MTTPNIEILQALEAGNSVAEFDIGLRQYFLRTQIFTDFVSDKYDIVKGDKGSGKSAIFRLAKDGNVDDIFRQELSVISGFNETGTPIFRRISEGGESTERALQTLWKMYIFAVTANYVADKFSPNLQKFPTELKTALVDNNLREPISKIEKLFSTAKKVVSGGDLNFNLGGSNVNFSLKFGSAKYSELEDVIESLLEKLDDFLDTHKHRCWMAFDPLDEAFADNRELERIALTNPTHK